MDRFSKNILFLYGIGLAATYTAAAKFKEGNEKIFRSIEKADGKLLEEFLRNELAYHAARQKIKGKQALSDFIEEQPEYQKARWVNDFGMHGIVELPKPIETVAYPVQSLSPSPQTSLEDMASDLQPKIDYGWLNSDFIKASKVVFGAKGSGKSRFLAYEAIEFLRETPNGELRIGDRHYDAEESEWLPGIPPEILESNYVAKDPKQIFALFRRAKKLLATRVEQGIKANHQEFFEFKFICDEFEAFMISLSDDQRKEVLGIIAQSQNEGRKYGINLTIGLHSLKKEIIGIDSSILFQMDVLCLGASLSDPNTRFPADFNPKKLLVEQQQVQSTLGSKDGFACVVRRLGQSPEIKIIPWIDLSRPEFRFGFQSVETDEENDRSAADWEEQIWQWIKNINRDFSPSELKTMYQELVGRSLNDEQLKVIYEYFTKGK